MRSHTYVHTELRAHTQTCVQTSKRKNKPSYMYCSFTHTCRTQCRYIAYITYIKHIRDITTQQTQHTYQTK